MGKAVIEQQDAIGVTGQRKGHLVVCAEFSADIALFKIKKIKYYLCCFWISVLLIIISLNWAEKDCQFRLLNLIRFAQRTMKFITNHIIRYLRKAAYSTTFAARIRMISLFKFGI